MCVCVCVCVCVAGGGGWNLCRGEILMNSAAAHIKFNRRG